MRQVQSDPLSEATELKNITMNDSRCPASDGWVKMQRVVQSHDGSKTVVHFNYNKATGAFDDFKY